MTEGQLENKEQMVDTNLTILINTLNLNKPKLQLKGRISDWIKKKWDPIVCHLQETDFTKKKRYTKQTKSSKRTNMAILRSEKDLETKNIREKEGHCLTLKESIP